MAKNAGENGFLKTTLSWVLLFQLSIFKSQWFLGKVTAMKIDAKASSIHFMSADVVLRTEFTDVWVRHVKHDPFVSLQMH